MDGGILKVEHVRWIDSTSIDAWTEVEDSEINPHVVDSVGIHLKENDICLWLALNYDSYSEAASCSVMIPKVAIQERKVLCQVKMTKKQG